MDTHGNINAQEGLDRCHECGNKYWENDKCIDCGLMVEISRNRYRGDDFRISAEMVLRMRLDSLGLICGTVVPVEDDDTNGRLLPTHTDLNGQTWGLIVKDAK